MPITTNEEEDLAISCRVFQRDVINRMITLINELEQRIEALEAR
jgi:predicted enzyme involved in methoxymalonyl-ACP biosynthesis